MRTLTPAAIAELNKLASSGVFLWLLKITHESLSPVYLVNNTKDITSNNQIYTAFPFTLKLADETKDQFNPAQLDIANVNRQPIQMLRSVSIESPLTFTATLILASAPDTAVIGPMSWIVKEASGDGRTISITLGMRSLRGQQFPAIPMGPNEFPALHRTF